MSTEEIKPLNWQPEPNLGYTVARRPDGGMHYTFTDLSHETVAHWREFALQHLLDSDRLTRNLYDLRQIMDLTEEAARSAIEVNSDPSTRNVRVAVLVSSHDVRDAVQKITALTTHSGVEIAIFTDPAETEGWLNRPLTLLV